MALSEKLYKKLLVHRYDDPGYLKYYTAVDYPGLRDEPFFFRSGDCRLSAHRYAYDGAGDSLILFCHGIGGGHLSYMREIELLCRRGFTVIAWDNTGCFASEGADIRCLSQSLADLDAAVAYLKETGVFSAFRRVSVVGHSWGGYAAANIPAFQSGIEKAVVISGFVSAERLLLGMLGGAKDPVRRAVLRRLLAFERAAAPKYAAACALDPVNAGGTKYLFAHSTDDPTVSYAYNTEYIQKNAAAPAEYLISGDRKHNPNYTADAAAYLNETFGSFNRALRRGKLKTPEDKRRFFADADWDRMTAQDPLFWEKVFAFLTEKERSNEEE